MDLKYSVNDFFNTKKNGGKKDSIIPNGDSNNPPPTFSYQNLLNEANFGNGVDNKIRTKSNQSPEMKLDAKNLSIVAPLNEMKP